LSDYCFSFWGTTQLFIPPIGWPLISLILSTATQAHEKRNLYSQKIPEAINLNPSWVNFLGALVIWSDRLGVGLLFAVYPLILISIKYRQRRVQITFSTVIFPTLIFTLVIGNHCQQSYQLGQG